MTTLARAVLLAAVVPGLAWAGAAFTPRELSGRDNRFVDWPAAAGEGSFRAVAPGRRFAFDAEGVRLSLGGGAKSGGGALRYAFEGAARVAPEGLNPSATRYHWFVGEPGQWVTDRRSFGAIAYRGLWPGVDATYAGDAAGFKYQFELAAGVDPATVSMVVTGADGARLTPDGALEWRVGDQVLVDQSPLSFQGRGGSQVAVATAYRLQPVAPGTWRVGFAVADHDKSQPLVIDPAWTGFSGLVGGSSADQVNAVARDGAGNTYACGVTSSANLPQNTATTYKAADDAFFVKFNAAGVAQVVAYVGGNGDDTCRGIAVDGSGRIYLAGATSGTAFPAVGTDGTNRFRRTRGTDRDAFVMRFAASGSTIEYSGFIGGSEDDQANAIAVDTQGRAYVTGFTRCTAQVIPGCTTAGTAFPAFVGPSLSHGGDLLLGQGLDAFVARVAAGGGTLEYAGFIGGLGGVEMGNGIAVGADFAAYVAGETDSTNVPGPGGFRTTANARPEDGGDGFVAKVAPNGAALGYFTLLTGAAPTGGLSGVDRALAIAVEADGSVAVAGETDSQNFPADGSGVRVGAGPQAASGGGMDGFVLRLNPDGNAVTAATYIGGTGFDAAEAVASDGAALFVAGTTLTGTGFPTVAQSGLATTRPGLQDGFIARIVRATPGSFAYAGYLGTSGNESIRAIAAAVVGATTTLSLGGTTTSAGPGLVNPVTGAMGPAGGVNGLVLRIDPFGLPASIAVQAGANQVVPVNSAFPLALSVVVRDADSAPVPGVSVTFTAPGAGASAALTPPATVTTDGTGRASVAATANGTAGGYAVTATAGALSVPIPLSNVAALDPAADADGDGIPNGVEPGEGRNPLVKDNDIFAVGRLFAMQQYRDILGREGDPGGLAGWTAFLAGGGTRASVVEQFMGAFEFKDFAEPVARLYFAAFVRPPDAAGLFYWMAQARGGLSFAAMAATFASSGEFTARYGALSNGDFIDQVYLNVLGRPSDPGGKAYWLAQLDGGAVTRGGLLLGFAESPEHLARRANPVFVSLVFDVMLRRPPAFAGLLYWVTALGGGTPRQALVEAILATTEYRNRFLP